MIPNKKILYVLILFLLVLFAPERGPAIAAEVKQEWLTPEEIRGQAARFLIGNLPWKEDRMEITIFYRGKGMKLPRGKSRLVFEMPDRAPKIGNIPLMLRASLGNGYQKVLRLRARVKVSRELVVIRHFVRRGQILTPADLAVTQVKTTQMIRGAATRIADVAGLEIRRNLDVGDVVKLMDLKRPFLVKRGDRVLLVAEKGMMKITAPGIIREKGMRGSMVQVVNAQTKKEVYGLVVDSKTVKIIY